MYRFCRQSPLKRRLLVVVFCFIMFASSAFTMASTTVPEAVMKAAQSVVRIETEYTDKFVYGTGFVVKSDALSTVIATNYHVVSDDPLQIYVWLSDEDKINAHILSFTDQKDLCLLELAYPVAIRPVLLSETASVRGDAVYAVGFPSAADILSDTEAHSSAEATITDGIIGATRQTAIVEHGPLLSILQINADINPGNSGGPLLASDGTVVGINTYGVTQGINGSISVSELIKFMQDNGIEYSAQRTGMPWWFWLILVVAACIVALAAVFLIRKWRTASHGRTNTWKKQKRLTLRTYMDQHPDGLGIQQATALLMPVALQMRDMHNNGVLHLQASPDSVWIENDRTGLSAPSDLESDRYTSGFAAPEVYRGRSIGSGADVYSFSALLYYAASGLLPANALDRMEGAALDAMSALDEAYADILTRGLAVDIGQRTNDMQTLIHELLPYNVAVTSDGSKASFRSSAGNHKPFADKREDAAVEDETVGAYSEKTGNSPVDHAVLDTAAEEAGAQTSDVQPSTEEQNAPRKRNRIWIPVIAGALFLTLVIGAYFILYQQTKHNAEAGDFSAAEKCLILPGITKLHDSRLPAYVEAGLALGKRDFDTAEQGFAALAGYLNADEMILETQYRHAAQLADAGEFDDSIAIFRKLGDGAYKDSCTQMNDVMYRKGVYVLYELADYRTALSIFEGLKNVGRENAQEMCYETIYLWAGSYYESGDYPNAYEKLQQAKGYPPADDALKALLPVMYAKAQSKYRAGQLDDAKKLFACISPYQRSKDYLYFVQIHDDMAEYGISCYYNMGFNGDKIVKKLLGMLEFEDAAELIVMAQNLASAYLQGNWKTADGRYHINMTATGSISYNLPCIDYGDHYTIRDGVCIFYKASNENANRDIFRFTVISATIVKIYCYKDGKTYTLYKN